MEIRQLSAVVESKLRQLDKQLKQLTRNHAEATDVNDQQRLARDIEALTVIRQKLVKSHNLALQAHKLERSTNEETRANERLLGLALCVISFIGALAIVAYAILYV